MPSPTDGTVNRTECLAKLLEPLHLVLHCSWIRITVTRSFVFPALEEVFQSDDETLMTDGLVFELCLLGGPLSIFDEQSGFRTHVGFLL